MRLPPEVFSAIRSLLREDQILEGPHRERFEQAFAQRIGARFAVGVSSARAGLRVAVESLGFKPGDEILCPAYGFAAMPAVLRGCGLVPVFVEPDPSTWNLDLSGLEKGVSPRTRAILVTHLFGQPCDLQPILEIARRKGVAVIEDCAHALGARYQGRAVGSFGEIGLFSFGPGKNLPCFGGGMVTTADAGIARRIKEQVERGRSPSSPVLLLKLLKDSVLALGTGPLGFHFIGYPVLRFLEGISPGFSDRLTEERVPRNDVQRLANLQAAVGLAGFSRLEKENRIRRGHAEFFNHALADLPAIQLPRPLDRTEPIYLYYRISVPDRDRFRRELLRLGVDTKRDDMANCGGSAYPAAESLTATGVELPNDPDLTEGELCFVAEVVRRAVLGRIRPVMSAHRVTAAPMMKLSGR